MAKARRLGALIASDTVATALDLHIRPAIAMRKEAYGPW